MKRKNNEGFTLIETLIAIVVLGIVVVPVCSSLVMSFRMNEKADALLQDQLAVSSVVETLMAEGISNSYMNSEEADEHYNPDDNYGWMKEEDTGKMMDRFPNINVKAVRVTLNAASGQVENQGVGSEQIIEPYYDVTVSAGDVSVITKIRAVTSSGQEGEGTG